MSGYDAKPWLAQYDDRLRAAPAAEATSTLAAFRRTVARVPESTAIAYVSARPGQAADAQQLIAYCKERLAAYKYPRAVEVLDELPKTVSGKILRRELRARS
ncbi:AMP-binding enzyme [Amycolatopsis anabasis]|uniref:AMP-binding enzyme n=1 Tax=Amycolatopsis anabasis TaxID=1840409 RepID=UPI003CCCD3BB